MEKLEVISQVVEVIKSITQSKKQIKLDSNYIVDLDHDSLDCVETIIALEEKFHIEIKDEEVDDMNTVQDTVNLVWSKIEKVVD